MKTLISIQSEKEISLSLTQASGVKCTLENSVQRIEIMYGSSPSLIAKKAWKVSLESWNEKFKFEIQMGLSFQWKNGDSYQFLASSQFYYLSCSAETSNQSIGSSKKLKNLKLSICYSTLQYHVSFHSYFCNWSICEYTNTTELVSTFSIFYLKHLKSAANWYCRLCSFW